MGSPGVGGAIALVLAVTIGLVIVGVVLTGRVVGARSRSRASAPGDLGVPGPPNDRERRAAVVINPTKVADPARSRARAVHAFGSAGWAEPLWLETTAADPGRGQTMLALDSEVDLVLAEGGDGTVRAVADALTGTATPLGLIPLGTGNLLARNLGIPLVDGAAALDIALHGRTRSIDVGRVVVLPAPADDVDAVSPPPAGEERDGDRPDALPEQTFLVMAGLGFDAEVMATTLPRLKERVGWWAYVVAGAAQLRGRRTKVEIILDGETRLVRRIRSVIIGNCGELTGGVRLMPDAKLDDGWLDVVVVSPRTVPGWAVVTLNVLARSRRQGLIVSRYQCKTLSIRADRPIMAQLDGDPVGLALGLDAHVAHLALHVQVRR